MKIFSAIIEWYRFRKVVRVERKFRGEEQKITITWKCFLVAFLIVIVILTLLILLSFFYAVPPLDGALRNA